MYKNQQVMKKINLIILIYCCPVKTDQKFFEIIEN